MQINCFSHLRNPRVQGRFQDTLLDKKKSENRNFVSSSAHREIKSMCKVYTVDTIYNVYKQDIVTVSLRRAEECIYVCMYVCVSL